MRKESVLSEAAMMTDKDHRQLIRHLAKRFPPSQFLSAISFLTRLFEETKRLSKRYDYAIFSEDIGTGKGNGAWMLLNNKRPLSTKVGQKIAAAIGLRGKEKEYFHGLVDYDIAYRKGGGDAELKRLLQLKADLAPSPTESHLLDLYNEWYHAVIFELCGVEDFQNDPNWIAKALNFPLTTAQIEESLTVLTNLGLIQLNADATRYVKVKDDLDTGHLVPGIGVMRFHSEMLDLAKSAMDYVPAEEREIGAVTMNVSSEGAEAIRAAVRQFREYLMYLGSKHRIGNDLVQINIQVFPLTKTRLKKDSNDGT